MKFLVLEPTGTVGHMVALYLKERGHNVIGYDKEKSQIVDTVEGNLYDRVLLKNTILSGGYDAVVNCAAVINEDAEANQAEASYINTFLPHFLEQITRETNIIIVHRSTDCIYSGEKGQYSLIDVPDGKSFYARSKALGELYNSKDITLRTSLVGPELIKEGKSLLNWFINQSGEVKGFANAIWTGLTTLEFAKVIEYLVETRASGCFQCVPKETPISKYHLLCLFEKYFPKNRTIIRIENALVDKSLLPEYGETILHIPSYEEMIAEMADFINQHKNLYKHY